MVERTISLPNEFDRYMKDTGRSLSLYLQSKIREEIIKDGVEQKYHLKDCMDKRFKKEK